MRLLTFILSLISFMALQAQKTSLTQRLHEVDRAIEESPRYVAQREARITEARRNYGAARQTAGKYEFALQLYELYKPFVSDSAIYFLREGIRLSDQLGDRSAAVYCRSLLAIRCANIGMYDEALCILDSIHIEGVDTLTMGTYYAAYNNVYNELAYYTRLDLMRSNYLDKAQAYEELMVKYLSPKSETILMRREQRAQGEGRLEDAMKINDEWMATVEQGSHPYALAALYRYIEFKLQGDSVQMMNWLVESVLADIRNAAMDQGSMWELANELMLKGDIERASHYISFTSDCATRYGSRQRLWQIGSLLNDIAKTYKDKSEHTTSQLRLGLIAISVLVVLLLCALFFLHRRNRQLDVAREALHDTNDKLAALNEELTSANEQLSASNGQLAILNAKLKDANNVKDEYIGRFLSLCSQYIDKLDNYRKMVNKKMKNKEYDELFHLTKSTELKDQEIEELNQSFDSVFLHLFPNFVNDFNALLQPDYQVSLKEENRLSTDLRIFALIRLGIDDSSKIAEFLHYSVNTIYNYRARIKNGALDNRDQFERKVKEIGMPK
jgi:DNA-binding CsgD family transcriptional regulator